MLSTMTAYCTLPARDLERAKRFYKEKFDLSPSEERPDRARYECGDGTRFALFISTGESRGDFTQMGLQVPDVRKAVAELKAQGLTFEQYDFPGLKTDADGVADLDGELGAWFKDSEGNLIAIGERMD